MIIIAATGMLVLLFFYLLVKKKEEKLQKRMAKFSELGTANNLAFSSQELLHNRIIGLDGIKRTLLIFDYRTKKGNCLLINLEDVESCKVKEIYQPMSNNNAGNRMTETYLEKIVLEFARKHSESVELPFYEFNKNHIMKTRALGKKAKHWETILSKMINRDFKKTA